MYFLGEMWSDEDVGYFLNETFKTVDYHGWPTKKKNCYREAKNCLKSDFQGLIVFRIIQLSSGVLPSHKYFNE